MFNVTIINIKKTTKYIITLLISLLTVYILTKSVAKIQTSRIVQINISKELIKCLSKEIPAIENTYEESTNTIKEDEEEEETTNIIAQILSIELAQVRNIEKQDNIIIAEETDIKEVKVEEAKTNQETEIVTQNPIAETHNAEINGVEIKNETDFEINDSIIANELAINKDNITIFHTHTCESYTPSEQYPYEQTGNFRTTDLNYSVARVGDELANYLLNYNYNVIHDKTYHDYPAYSGSYTRSLETVKNLLKTNSSDVIIDLHRDAIGSKSTYDPSVTIGDETVARLMFVIGTNGGGLYHPNWQSNLKFAIEVQKKANELYPGLFKPIIVRNSRYNQHLGKAACIIEVGATGNSLEQCLGSMKYLSKVLDEVLKTN